jgi:two-component system chemotaxis response regulator CheY
MKKILVVEDSSIMRSTIKRVLSDKGYHVTTAGDGLEALKEITNGSFNLIISDINMPKMDGLELVKNVRDNAKTKFVPIIMLTTESSKEKINSARSLGANAYIVKPFSENALIEAVKIVCLS